MDGLILQKQPFSSKQRAPILNRKSHTISKFKPKIRIIHIFAPQIIKTDATNFRELVQRLTGKPTSNIEEKKTIRSSKPNNAMRIIERLKEGEEEIWTAADSGCGFLGDFTDFDGIFMQDLPQTSFLETTTTMDSSHYARFS